MDPPVAELSWAVGTTHIKDVIKWNRQDILMINNYIYF